MKELYVKGNDKEISEIIEYAKERIGKDKVSVFDLCPRVLPWDYCECGGEFNIICDKCGEEPL